MRFSNAPLVRRSSGIAGLIVEQVIDQGDCSRRYSFALHESFNHVPQGRSKLQRVPIRFSQVGRSSRVQWPESRLAAALLTRHH